MIISPVYGVTSLALESVRLYDPLQISFTNLSAWSAAAFSDTVIDMVVPAGSPLMASPA